MSLKKCCPRCGTIIDYADKYCEECSKKVKKDKAESNKQYDKNVRKLRDKQYTSFYHSREWIKTVEVVKSKYKCLDIYSYYVLGVIEYGNICHHIELLKTSEGWEHRLDIEGLIYLTNTNHATIHSLYEKDYEGTKKMLRELIDRWNKEFGGNISDYNRSEI